MGSGEGGVPSARRRVGGAPAPSRAREDACHLRAESDAGGSLRQGRQTALARVDLSDALGVGRNDVWRGRHGTRRAGGMRYAEAVRRYVAELGAVREEARIRLRGQLDTVVPLAPRSVREAWQWPATVARLRGENPRVIGLRHGRSKERVRQAVLISLLRWAE